MVLVPVGQVNPSVACAVAAGTSTVPKSDAAIRPPTRYFVVFVIVPHSGIELVLAGGPGPSPAATYASAIAAVGFVVEPGAALLFAPAESRCLAGGRY